jgi:hypothetical protein
MAPDGPRRVRINHLSGAVYYRNMDYLQRYLYYPQAKPVNVATQMGVDGEPGKRLLFRSIQHGLKMTRLHLSYVQRQLVYYDEKPWNIDVQEFVSKYLMAGMFFLSAGLDGFVVLDNDKPTANMSFQNTSLHDPTMKILQERINTAKSMERPETATMYADYWVIWNFFKHYNGHSWLPKKFGGRWDFVVPFRSDDGDEAGESGAIVSELVVPIYNEACELLQLFAAQLHEACEVDRLDAF